MTTYPHRVHLHRPRVNLWLVAVVGLAAALIGLASWVLVDHYAGGSSATQDATTLFDKFDNAGNAGDSAALSAILTNDVVMRSEGTVISGKQALIAAAVMSSTQGPAGLRVERIAPVTVTGDFATTFIRATEGGASRTVLAVQQFKDGKIFRIWGFSLGTTPPFDNTTAP